jgi:hypothetical protein
LGYFELLVDLLLMNPVHKKLDLVVQEYDGETLVYDLSSHRAFCLNQTSALVWKCCDGSMNAAELARRVSSETGEDFTVEIVSLALEQLKKEGLLENEVLPEYFGGISRREVVRKVGAATMVALPLITAITAPTAAHAQSTCTFIRQGCLCSVASAGRQGQPCTAATGSECASNACRCVWAANGGTNGDCVA